MSMQKRLLRLLGARPISFNPELARLTGSLEAGLLLSQFLYWQQVKGEGAWFFKTAQDIEAETYLSRRGSEGARKRLCELQILEEEKRGVPCRVFYRVNLERLLALIEQTDMPETGEPDCADPPIQFVQSEQTSLYGTYKQDCSERTNLNTESTQRDTPEKTTENTQERERVIALPSASALIPFTVPRPPISPLSVTVITPSAQTIARGLSRPLAAPDLDLGDMARAIICAHPKSRMRNLAPHEAAYTDVCRAIEAIDEEAQRAGCSKAEAAMMILDSLAQLADKLPRDEWRFLKPPGEFLHKRDYRLHPNDFLRSAPAERATEPRKTFAEMDHEREEQAIREAHARRAGRG